jgi:hypothetical protein
VVAEESDLTIDGQRSSHYEMYIEAMKACEQHDGSNILSEVNSEKYFVAIKKAIYILILNLFLLSELLRKENHMKLLQRSLLDEKI